MKDLFLVCILIVASLFMACEKQSTSFSSQVGNNDEEVYDFNEPVEIEEFIDLYAGHPYDPDLPVEVYGVTDQELEEIHPRDLQKLFTEGIDYALENLDEPRYLFAIGRAGYIFDHDRTSEWLIEASEEGSVAALAYIGYKLFDESYLNEAVVLMDSALRGGFNDPLFKSTLKLARESVFNPNLFNRPNYIQALHDHNISILIRDGIGGGHYIGAMQNVLWQNDILFLVDNPKILLDLSPEINAKEGFLVRKAENSWLGGVFLVAEEGKQDARRLAMLYENNPRAFKKVYAGMMAYSKEK